jgi:MarR family transcriptional regulator, organic hydroperoxide resistance regulator
MEAMGLIARRRDGADGRVSRVHLTARGKKLERTLVPIAIGVINRAVAGLPRADVDRLKATLDRIKANLDCVSPPSSARRRSRASGP